MITLKTQIKSIEGKDIKEVSLPGQFNEKIRPDLIKRAVLVIHANNRQAYGAYFDAGTRNPSKTSKRRRDYKTSYGHGISRVPRKILSYSGTRFNWVGAFAPHTVGGRKAHPPKAEKIWDRKINKKERRKAIRSALAASVDKNTVKERGHIFEDYPIVIENKFEEMKNTKEVISFLNSIGLEKELLRAGKKKIRAGRGKSRGRKYKTSVGPLLVVSKECNLLNSARNIPGIDVEIITNLNAEMLAPGTDVGRLTIYTENAILRIKMPNWIR